MSLKFIKSPIKIKNSLSSFIQSTFKKHKMKKNRLSQFDSTVNILVPAKSFFEITFSKTKSLLFLFTLSFVL